MSFRDNMREYRKATIAIFGGIGLIIFGFIVGIASIALGIVLLYTPTNSYTYTTSSSDNEIFKWAISAGIFGFCCIIAGYSMIGGGCRMCFSSCSECCSSGFSRMDCSDLECCGGGGGFTPCCWGVEDSMKNCCSCCTAKEDSSVSYDNYETGRQEHTIVHMGYENKQEIPLEVVKMQQEMATQPIQTDLKTNVPISDSNNIETPYMGGYSGVATAPADETPSYIPQPSEIYHGNEEYMPQVGVVEQTVEYHRSQSNEAVEINAPSQV